MSKHKGIPSFKRESKELERVLKELPDVVGQTAVDHAHDNFDREGFKDGGKIDKWQSRKDRKGNQGKNILVQTGQLKASIDYDVSGKTVSVGSDKVYAKMHNEGGKTGRNHSVQMPQRKFMDNSKDIEEAVEKHLDNEMDKIFG
ncbi:phage virion morphogenesis protein [Reichenbachiella sp.]|uniref:phage virion morphogenesis protein n=1 Tax=Reichenbachiella sp. TaxID=2184521 RepID=UPI003B597E74